MRPWRSIMESCQRCKASNNGLLIATGAMRPRNDGEGYAATGDVLYYCAVIYIIDSVKSKTLSTVLEKPDVLPVYLRMSDGETLGLTTYETRKLAHSEHYERVGHGLYMRSDQWNDLYYVLALQNEKIIFSHMSALYFHGLSEKETRAPVVSVVKGYNASHLRRQGIDVHEVRAEWFELGRTEALTNFYNPIPVYDKERSICDIVRYRKRMDSASFGACIRNYFSYGDTDIQKLSDYARILGVEEEISMYAEVLL